MQRTYSQATSLHPMTDTLMELSHKINISKLRNFDKSIWYKLLDKKPEEWDSFWNKTYKKKANILHPTYISGLLFTYIYMHTFLTTWNQKTKIYSSSINFKQLVAFQCTFATSRKPLHVSSKLTWKSIHKHIWPQNL